MVNMYSTGSSSNSVKNHTTQVFADDADIPHDAAAKTFYLLPWDDHRLVLQPVRLQDHHNNLIDCIFFVFLYVYYYYISLLLSNMIEYYHMYYIWNQHVVGCTASTRNLQVFSRASDLNSIIFDKLAKENALADVLHGTRCLH